MNNKIDDCIFCSIPRDRIISENDLTFAIRDNYPVTTLHSLIIPKRHVIDYFDLTNDELIACNDLIQKVKEQTLNKDKSVKAFNIGTNAGKMAGQSIMHCHIHLIPRRKGDVENPQGGVRSVIPKKQHYKRKI